MDNSVIILGSSDEEEEDTKSSMSKADSIDLTDNHVVARDKKRVFSKTKQLTRPGPSSSSSSASSSSSSFSSSSRKRSINNVKSSDLSVAPLNGGTVDGVGARVMVVHSESGTPRKRIKPTKILDASPLKREKANNRKTFDNFGDDDCEFISSKLPAETTIIDLENGDHELSILPAISITKRPELTTTTASMTKTTPPPETTTTTTPAATATSPTDKSKNDNTPITESFTALIDACRKADSSADMEMLINKKLIRYYRTVHPDFVNSKSFKKNVLSVTEEINAQPGLVYLKLSHILEELNSRRKSNLTVVSNEEVTSTGNAKKDFQIKRLNQALYILKKKIAKLDEEDVDLNDEDNSPFLLCERYKKRACEIYEKICDITGESKHAQRLVRKPITFQGTNYPAFNKTIQSFVNRTRIFPDMFDVLRCLEHCNTQYDFQLTKEEIKRIAQDAFIQIGKLLQKRRKTDLYETVSLFTGTEADPAIDDTSLQEKLQENKKYHNRINEIIDKYAAEQEKVVPDESTKQTTTTSPSHSATTEATKTTTAGTVMKINKNTNINLNTTKKNPSTCTITSTISSAAAVTTTTATAPAITTPSTLQTYSTTTTTAATTATTTNSNLNINNNLAKENRDENENNKENKINNNGKNLIKHNSRSNSTATVDRNNGSNEVIRLDDSVADVIIDDDDNPDDSDILIVLDSNLSKDALSSASPTQPSPPTSPITTTKTTTTITATPTTITTGATASLLYTPSSLNEINLPFDEQIILSDEEEMILS